MYKTVANFTINSKIEKWLCTVIRNYSVIHSVKSLVNIGEFECRYRPPTSLYHFPRSPRNEARRFPRSPRNAERLLLKSSLQSIPTSSPSPSDHIAPRLPRSPRKDDLLLPRSPRNEKLLGRFSADKYILGSSPSSPSISTRFPRSPRKGRFPKSPRNDGRRLPRSPRNLLRDRCCLSISSFSDCCSPSSSTSSTSRLPRSGRKPRLSSSVDRFLTPFDEPSTTWLRCASAAARTAD